VSVGLSGSSSATTGGVLFVHSCPPALCPHVEWAVAAELGTRVRLTWTEQPCSPGTLRAETGWRGLPGTAGRLAAALRGWTVLRFEVTEEPSRGLDGERYSATPDLGTWRGTVGATGDVQVGEDRIRELLATTSGPQLAQALDRVLGSAWDAELEPFREAGEGAPVTWLHQVG
jgi:hypothetical protein